MGARYLSRELDVTSSDFYAWSPTSQLFTDTQGLLPYADAELSVTLEGEPPEYVVDFNPVAEYLDGMAARQEIDAEGDPTATYYMHGDLIGSVSALTDPDGDPVNVAGGGVSGSDPSPVVCYTAFGERVVYASSTVTIGGDLPAEFARAGYSGQTGYESGFLKLEGANTELAPITLQHLGHRWYQPSVGRFAQVDPLGLAAGLNAYLYCNGDGIRRLDPMGTESQSWSDIVKQALWKPVWMSDRTFLSLTGGVNSTYTERVLGRFERWNSNSANLTAAFTSWRVGKGGCVPGYPSTTSIWTKVPGISLKTGMIVGRWFSGIAIVLACHDVAVLVDSAVQEW